MGPLATSAKEATCAQLLIQPYPTPHKGHVMDVSAVQASGTDQAYSPSFDTFARCPPVSGDYSNVSESGICHLSGPRSYKDAVTQMHADINALHVHGPQCGVDTDPIRATYAYRDQIERRFNGRSADPANHVTH